MKKLLHLVGYLHRCTKMLHGHTNVKFVGGMIIILLVKCRLCHGNYGFKFSCTSCITCCHSTHMVEIFRIVHLFFFNCQYWGLFYPPGCYPKT